MLTAMTIMAAVSTGISAFSAFSQARANERSLKSQRKGLKQEQEEIERQKKREIEQKKRENMQLMNTVSGLTNTAFAGVSSPSIDYDKYGDLG